jgi:hypothetical protein
MIFWLLLFASIACFLCGLLAIMAGGMSDAPAEGDASARFGFMLQGIAVAVLVLDFVARHNHWFDFVYKLVSWGNG